MQFNRKNRQLFLTLFVFGVVFIEGGCDGDGANFTSEVSPSESQRESCESQLDLPSGTWFGLDGSDVGPVSERASVSDFSSGGISDSEFWLSSPAVALDKEGRPTVAWVQYDDAGSSEIYLRRFKECAWQEADSSASAGGVSQSGVEWGTSQPSIALDFQGDPMVVWTESGHGCEALHEDEAACTAHPGCYFDVVGGTAFDGSAIHCRGHSRIRLKRLGESGWEGLADSATIGLGRTEAYGSRGLAEVAIDPNTGFPWVVWSELYFEHREIYGLRWSGSEWIEAGSSNSAGGISSTLESDSFSPKLRFSAEAKPYLMWTEFISSYQLPAMLVFNGLSWETLGSNLLVNVESVEEEELIMTDVVPTFEIDGSDQPVVIWHRNIIDTELASTDPQNAFSSAVYWQRWDGVSWGESLVMVADHYQPGNQYYPLRVARDDSGQLFLAFVQDTDDENIHEVQAYAFSGEDWKRVPTGLSETGLSNSEGSSIDAQIASGGGRTCVVYSDGAVSELPRQIILRCIE